MSRAKFKFSLNSKKMSNFWSKMTNLGVENFITSFYEMQKLALSWLAKSNGQLLNPNETRTNLFISQNTWKTMKKSIKIKNQFLLSIIFCMLMSEKAVTVIVGSSIAIVLCNCDIIDDLMTSLCQFIHFCTLNVSANKLGTGMTSPVNSA